MAPKDMGREPTSNIPDFDDSVCGARCEVGGGRIESTDVDWCVVCASDNAFWVDSF